MNELEQLLEIMGTPERTAKALKITERTFYNYKKSPDLPPPVKQHILLLLAALKAGTITPDELVGEAA